MMDKPPLHLQTFQNILLRKLEKGAPVWFQTSTGHDRVKGVRLIPTPSHAVRNTLDPDDDWMLQLRVAEPMSQAETFFEFLGSAVGRLLVISKVDDQLVVHRSWRKPVSTVREEVVAEDINNVTRLTHSLIEKAARGQGPRVYLQRRRMFPDPTDPYYFVHLVEITHDLTAVPPSVELAVQASETSFAVTEPLATIESRWTLSKVDVAGVRSRPGKKAWLLHEETPEVRAAIERLNVDLLNES